MRAFIVSVSLALILTTSAVAAAMEYLDQVQTTFARPDATPGKAFTLAALKKAP